MHVEGGGDPDAHLGESRIAHQRASEVARADKNGVAAFTEPEESGYIRGQVLDQIADPRLTAGAYGRKVLPDLNLAEAEGVRNLPGGNIHRPPPGSDLR
jgi:hypothetical protein